MEIDELFQSLGITINERQKPVGVKMCKSCSRRHAGGKKHCRLYRSIKPGIAYSTTAPKRQKEVKAMTPQRIVFAPEPVQ
jgi:hypothetical protein